ncbi:MAG: glycosyltransferase family 4 protein [Alphaproteobacteria bacterium]
MPLSTLHIDIEGGWGGSSRSLYELLSRIDRNRIAPVVVHRQAGPITQWYADTGIPVIHVPEIGSFVPRGRKALKNFIASLPRLARLGTAARRIAAIAETHGTQLIHLNYEGLFLLARKLRRLDLPMIAHSRAMVPADGWGRWLARSLAVDAAHMFFISPQEEARFRLLHPGTAPQGDILWNITRPVQPRRPLGDPPEVVSFGSLDRAKGTDRLIEVAAALRQLQAPPLRIAVYGLARTAPSFVAEVSASIVRLGLEDRIALRGFSDDPMTVMAGALALIRPSRDDDPWGRDVIEATAAGLPVLATGTYGGVVRHGETGFLFPAFDAREVAERLVVLHDDRQIWQRISDAAAIWGAQRFSGRQQAERFTSIVESTIANARHRGVS